MVLTALQGDGRQQKQQAADAELEPPTEDQGDGKRQRQNEHAPGHGSTGDQHRPALVMIEREPLEPLREPEEAFHRQQHRDETVGREAEAKALRCKGTHNGQYTWYEENDAICCSCPPFPW